ncbi:iron-sulfur-binding ferredoxin reductase [Pseudomonas sp. TE3610]
MPELIVGQQRWPVAAGHNLLDALNAQGLNVPYSCRAGSCHACLVRCLRGEPLDRKPDALDSLKRAEGWRLACQCQVLDDLEVAVFDPTRDGVPAEVQGCDWLSANVLRLRLAPQRPLRYQAGQHVVLWTGTGVARPYSLASLPQEDRWLEFHIDCRQPGAFADQARAMQVGDTLRLGELRGGALHYAPDWQDQPLWLLASGTGLAPLYGVLREAVRQGHHGEIRLVHVAHDVSEHYLQDELQALHAAHANLQVELLTAAEAPEALRRLRVQSRRTTALACGGAAAVEAFARQLFMAGLPRSQLLADVFVAHA